jgi:chromate transporter
MSEAEPKPLIPLRQIFSLFARIGLTSFGGGLSAWIYREVVARRRWLSEDEFLAGLTLAQILPGPNVINISIYIGLRLRGTRGSIVAALALLVPPMVVAVGLLALFNQFGELRWLHNLLEGIAAAAVGLTFSVAYSAARHATKSNHLAPIVLGIVFVSIAVLRWPLIPVVLCVAPLALLAVRKKRAGS